MRCEFLRLSAPRDAIAHPQAYRDAARQAEAPPATFFLVLRPLNADRRGREGRAAWYGPFASRRVAETLGASAFFLGAIQAGRGSSATNNETAPD